MEGAKSDLEVAAILFKANKNSQSLFWCHLALEKLLKACVVRKTNKQAPYTHSLVLLAQTSEFILSDEQKEWLTEIGEFNAMGRYPDETMDFTRKCTPEFTQRYLLITQTLYQWLLKKISSR